MKNQENYTEADWRCQGVVRISAPANLPGVGFLPEGSIGKVVGIVDYQAGKIAFSIPNATALFLNLSKKF